MANVILDDTHLTNIANAIREKNGEATTYTPGAMAKAITDLPSGGGGEPIVLTGDCSYAFYGSSGEKILNAIGDKISTEDMASAQNMFTNDTTLTRIPFALNFNSSTSSHTLLNCFSGMSRLEEVPAINNAAPNSMNYLFSGCERLRYLPEDFGLNWRWSGFVTSTGSAGGGIFRSCYSLRSVPTYFLSCMRNERMSATGHPYNYAFNGCYVLDKVEGLGVATGILSSNMCAYMFNYCHRLQEMTFKLSDYTDGNWVVSQENWKNQTIDLSEYVGYSNSLYHIITNYNSGITADKEVTDDTTYQALKNDADWFTCNINYSRYNHDSAVNTINSLPDTHAYGTNTIKFKGAAGALTDGGAINTLTEEEIAVATAKGWTVSLV